MAKSPSPFKYRSGWRAQVTLKNGLRPYKDFDNHAEAGQWIHDTKSKADTEHEPVLDGPSKATLAQALNYYARNYSIAKGGVVAELNRINRYLGPAGLPMLKAIEGVAEFDEQVELTAT